MRVEEFMETVTYKVTYSLHFSFKFEKKTWVHSDSMDSSHQCWNQYTQVLTFFLNEFAHH